MYVMIFAFLICVINTEKTFSYVQILPSNEGLGDLLGKGIGDGIRQGMAERQRKQQLEAEVDYIMLLQERAHQQRMKEIEEQKKLEELACQRRLKELEYKQQLKKRDDDEHKRQLKIKEDHAARLKKEMEWQNKRRNFLMVFILTVLTALLIYMFRRMYKK